MHNITLISTRHKENGACNADNLCKILEHLYPEVIFLEASEESYSEYDQNLFNSFGVFSERLEIQAIQKYNSITAFEYVPVLDARMSDAFSNKYDIVTLDNRLRKLIDNYGFLENNRGFKFLNSDESTKLQEEMRILEDQILNDIEKSKAANDTIDKYENNMLQNIYLYCKNHQFKTAVFMYGAAHRKSIIEKISKIEASSNQKIDWDFCHFEKQSPTAAE